MTTFSKDNNIILTGMLGTGKSTVGRLLAERLGREYVATDQQLEAHFGKSISEIIADEGEPTFRSAEIRLCLELAKQRGLVINSGADALINPEVRHAFADSGALICLTASVDEILERINAKSGQSTDPEARSKQKQRIRDLHHRRRHAYAAIAQRVDTNRRTPAVIVDHVLETLDAESEVAGMIRIPVQSPSGRYHICIGEGLIEHAGNLLQSRGISGPLVTIVSNQSIAAHYAQPLAESLITAGYKPSLCTLPEGEEHKSLDTIRMIYDHLMAQGMDRKSPLIALGGGVIGDMTGFAAATYLRGVPFVQMPTSLLSMVDASVGGKTGVDVPQGKNLIGAFKQPEIVIIDTAVMQTLPAAEFRAGLAETIKHGILAAPELFAQLEQYGPTGLNHLVADAIRVKVDVVEEDPFEQGRRALLNLGHTFGHALELVSNFRIGHGAGVALGLVAATSMAAELGHCSTELAERVTALVDRMGLPTMVHADDFNPDRFTVDDVYTAMAHDKKRKGGTLRFIIPKALGDVVIIDNPGEEIVKRAIARVVRSETDE